MRSSTLLAAILLLTSCGSGQKCEDTGAIEDNVSGDRQKADDAVEAKASGPVEIPDYSVGENAPEYAYGVGEHTAREQTFRADGTRVHDLELLVASNTDVEEPVVVEIRNDELDRRYGHGVIEASKAPGQVADWRTVTWEVTPELEVDGVYKILAYSSADYDVWQLIGGVDVYPYGEAVFGYGQDIGFRMRFEDGQVTNSGLKVLDRPVRRTSAPEDEGESGLPRTRRGVVPQCEGKFCGDFHTMPADDGPARANVAHLAGGVNSVVQTFVATGSSLQELELLLAKSEEPPAEPLVVEIRNERLDRRSGHGIIDASSPIGELAEWRAVSWEEQPELEPGRTYAIVAFSDADEQSWKLAGGVNVYPFGDSERPHISPDAHGGRDIGFRAKFANGETVEAVLAAPGGFLEDTISDGDDRGWGIRVNAKRDQLGPRYLPRCEGSVCGMSFSPIDETAGERASRAKASTEVCNDKVTDGAIVKMTTPEVGLTCADVCRGHDYAGCRGAHRKCDALSAEKLDSCASALDTLYEFDWTPACHCTTSARADSTEAPKLRDPWFKERVSETDSSFAISFRDKVWVVDSEDGSMKDVAGAPVHLDIGPEVIGSFVTWKQKRNDGYRIAFVDTQKGVAHEVSVGCMSRNECRLLAARGELTWMNVGEKESWIQPLPGEKQIEVPSIRLDTSVEMRVNWDGKKLTMFPTNYSDFSSWSSGDKEWKRASGILLSDWSESATRFDPKLLEDRLASNPDPPNMMGPVYYSFDALGLYSYDTRSGDKLRWAFSPSDGSIDKNTVRSEKYILNQKTNNLVKLGFASYGWIDHRALVDKISCIQGFECIAIGPPFEDKAIMVVDVEKLTPEEVIEPVPMEGRQ